MERKTNSLELLVYEALSYYCMRPEAGGAQDKYSLTYIKALFALKQVERKTNIASPTSLAAAPGGAASSLLRGGGHAQEETPAMKNDLSSAHHRELSLIAEDEERESNSRSNSRVDARHRQHSRERSTGEALSY